MTADERLDDVLTAFAAEDAAALIADMRQDAARIARERLVQAYVDKLMDAVARRAPAAAPTDVTGLRPSAPPSTGRTGCYVYAVVSGEGTGAGVDEPGVQPGGPVYVVRAGDVSAIVSDVDVDAMRVGGAAADLAEDGWLAAAVRAHEHVVHAASRSAPTVPMRFGIVHPDRDSVATVLTRHADELNDELRRIDGAAEWSVKVYAQPDVVATRLASGDEQPRLITPSAASATGRAFLLRERARRDVDERARSVVASRVEQLTSALTAFARDVVAVPTLSTDRPPVFSAAYLVDVADERRLADVVHEFAAETAELGMSVDLAGPWPPYHFTSLRLECGHD